MDGQFWLNKWDKMEVGFHQSEVNLFLKKYWNEFIHDKKIVFVPLCGASVDILWLKDVGLHVVGVELSEKAVVMFMQENNLKYDVEWRGDFKVFTADCIEIYCGDIFQFTQFNHIDCIYDRASLIALPSDMRKRYCELIKNNLAQADYFLVTISFDNSEIGPPFSVDQKMVEDYYHESFDVELKDQLSPDQPLVHTGNISWMQNNLFFLRPKN